MHIRKMAGVLIALLIAFLPTADAQDRPRDPPAQSASEPAPAQDPSAELIEAVRYEREALERQADRQIASVLWVAQIAGALLSLIITLGVGFFIWLFGSTRRELRESLHETATKQLREIVESEAEVVRAHVRRIDQELQALRQRRSSVTWIVRDEQDANNELVSLLQARSIELSAVAPSNGQPFEVGNPELVIVTYLPTEEGARRLRELVKQLQDRTPQVPIVVYTFDPRRETNRILPADEAVLSEYRWFVPANFPLQLVAQVTALVSHPRVEAGA